MKKKQQRVQMILDSKQIVYETIDITEPGREKEKEFMQQNGKVRENLGKYPLPPQIFNDEDFCGVSTEINDIFRKCFGDLKCTLLCIWWFMALF